MKRRRLIQYAGLGGVGLVTGVGSRALAAVISAPNPTVGRLDNLQSFNFEVVRISQQGQEIDRRLRQAQFFAVELAAEREASTPLEMVAVGGGRFVMGAPDAEKFSATHETPQHRVTVQPFFMGKYPVTQAQWRAVAALPRVNRDLNPNPTHFKGDDLPVESVSWLDAVEFGDRLSHLTGKVYRLPSEAEWEYACRAGTTTPFHYGKTITGQLANYGSAYTYAAETAGEYRQSTTPVGSFSPNAFGLYDMHGNVWEWCADHWHDGYAGAPTDGQAWVSGGNGEWRSLRGGGWADYPSRSRSAHRSGYPVESLNRMIGFRVCSA